MAPNVWAPIAFASRFLNSAETKYRTNELELLAIVWACEHFRTYLLGKRFVVLTDHKANISALNETYGKKSYQSRLSRWADRLIPCDYEVEHVPGSSLGIVDYMSRHPTLKAPLPSSHDELFVIKSIQAFHNALNSTRTPFRSKIVPVGQVSNHNRFEPIKTSGDIIGDIRHLLTKAVHPSSTHSIDSFDQSDSCNPLSSSSTEGVAFSNQIPNQSLEDKLISSNDISSLEGVQSCFQIISQSQASMQNRGFIFPSREVEFSSCSNPLDQSQPRMQMRYAKPEVCERNHCLRPYISKSSHDMITSKIFPQDSNLNNSNTSFNTIDLANNTIEQATLLNFVENFSTSSPNIRTPSHQRYGPSRASCMNLPSRIDQIRARNLARLKHSKDRFVVARGQSARKCLAQFLDNCRRQRLAKKARQEAVVRMGVNIINNHKPLVTRDKRKLSASQDFLTSTY